MAHIQKILVPVDGSPPSKAALREAAALAEDTGAIVDVVHIHTREETSLVELRDAMDDAGLRLGERLSRRTESGDPLGKILEIANDGDYDLIVMGTHGRVGRMHMLLGSVAEGVVRNAPCPVLTVRHPTGEEESFSERIHHVPSVGHERPSR